MQGLEKIDLHTIIQIHQ